MNEQDGYSALMRALRDDLAATATRNHLTSDRLEAYVDGTLASAERDAVVEHLAICRLCFNTAAELERLATSDWRDDVADTLTTSLATPVAGDTVRSGGLSAAAGAAAQRAWASFAATIADVSAWTAAPARMEYAGAEFAIRAAERPVDIQSVDDWLRWTQPVEDGEQIVYIDAIKAATVSALIFSEDQSVAPAWSEVTPLEKLNLVDTSFLWRKRIALGPVEALHHKFGAYRVMIAVRPEA